MTSLYFEFDDIRSAGIALDTLNELGFRSKPLVAVRVSGGDLTSALEITQAGGGRLKELSEPHEHHFSEVSAFNSAYGMDGIYGKDSIAVPAHLVNEDLPEAYMHPGGQAEADLGNHSGEEVNWMTPGIPS